MEMTHAVSIKKNIESRYNEKVILYSIISSSIILHILYMGTLNLIPEEAYYWNYAQHLDYSYLDHPPMIALLISLFSFFGSHQEVLIRMPSLICLAICGFFSYRLTEHIVPRGGIYALCLLMVLPYFYSSSVVITPEAPLLASWSALLYFLYRSFIYNEAKSVYRAGLALGLGMISKYLIVILGLTSLIYVFYYPKNRHWLFRKEPFIAILIALCCFVPVIYWNALHHWVSFLFQSERRFKEITSCHLGSFILGVFLFILPIGTYHLSSLISFKPQQHKINKNSFRFLKMFTYFPLAFFSIFSLTHKINLHWLGPIFLALIPWIVFQMQEVRLLKKMWIWTCFCLLFIYISIYAIAALNQSEWVQRKLLVKEINWQNVVYQFNRLASDVEKKYHQPVLFVPLDKYSLNSEFSFYQSKLKKLQQINKIYPITSAKAFGIKGLMFDLWNEQRNLSDYILVLVAKDEPWRFDATLLKQQIKALSELKYIWSKGQGQGTRNVRFYYQLAQIKQV